MLQFVRKTRIGEPVEMTVPRSIQLEPDLKPRTLLQRHRTRGMIPSRKMDQMIGWAIPLERDFVLHLEADPTIKLYAFRPEAGRVGVRLSGLTKSFIPSYGLEYLDGRTSFAAVCTEDQLAHPDHPQLCADIRAQYLTMGCDWVVVTATDIYRSPRFENVQLLDDAACLGFPDPWRALLAFWLAGDGPMDLRRLTETLGGGEVISRQLLAMVAAGLIEIDLDKPISPTTRLTLPRRQR